MKKKAAKKKKAVKKASKGSARSSSARPAKGSAAKTSQKNSGAGKRTANTSKAAGATKKADKGVARSSGQTNDSNAAPASAKRRSGQTASVQSVAPASRKLSRSKAAANDSKASGTDAKKKPAARGRKGQTDGRQARPAASATSHDPIQFAEEQTKIPKTTLTAKQLREFRNMLLDKRAELLGDVERLTDEALRRKIGGQSDGSTMPIHMADLGTDNWEQDFTLGLIANEQALVREIDAALQRIEDRTYGVCLATHQPIGLARLRAKPWAKYCIEYARAREEGRAR